MREASKPPVAPSPAGFVNALPPAVAEALRNGNKVEAIKRMRELTGLGLKEAKEAVEAVQPAVVPGAEPGKVPRRPGSAFLGLAVLVAAALAATWFLFGPG